MSEFDDLQKQDESASNASRGCPFARMTIGGGSESGSPTPLGSPMGKNLNSSADRGPNSMSTFQPSAARNFCIDNWMAENRRLVTVYEEFVHLVPVRAAWDSSRRANSSTGGDLMACLHALEIYLVTLSVSVADRREYVGKRSRIEVLTKNVAAMGQLLCQLHPIMADEWAAHCEQGEGEGDGAGASDGLRLLTESLLAAFPAASTSVQQCLRRMVLHLHSLYSSLRVSFGTNVGVEDQLKALGRSVGVSSITFAPVWGDRATTLNYNAAARPSLISSTLHGRVYVHPEDFFFRSMHLATECWARVAISCSDRAYARASQGRWREASEAVEQAATVLSLMGDHLLSLCSMNLRDYLHYKPEIYGASGEGSVAVKRMRSKVTSLLPPLVRALKASKDADADSANRVELAGGPVHGVALDICPSSLLPLDKAASMKAEDLEHFDLLGHLYLYPDRCDANAARYEYCKALEMLESALLSGFYHKHFVLASNVIGSQAVGTMHRNVQALKSSYSASCFPLLDVIRYSIAPPFEEASAGVKGKLISECAAKHGLPPAWPPS